MWRRHRHDRPAVARRLTSGTAAAALVGALLAAAPAALAVPGCSATQGQAYIDAGRYDHAIREFSCVIEGSPTEVEGYRGRAEALLLLGRFADAYADYYRGINALVVPVHPDAFSTIYAGYAARLAVEPDSISALTGASFARWVNFDYPQAIHVLDDLLAVEPDNVFGHLFRGSSRVLKGLSKGIADLDRALELDPTSPDVHSIVADAYTYGMPDPERAFAEATAAYEGGLHTPRVHAILAFAYLAFGDDAAAAAHIAAHINFVTTQLITTAPLGAGGSLLLDLAPGRVYDIPVPVAVAGQTISVATSSKDFYDSIGVLYDPDGTPVTGSDDAIGYFAALDWPAAVAGTYHLRVTSFEAVDTGVLKVTRD
jgi:tetratricopeptide (TPR) repeat protein